MIAPWAELRGEGKTVRAGVYAGLAGGLAEILWIALYQGGGNGAAAVAQGVTRVVVSGAESSFAIPMGIAIHLMLAILLGVAVAVFVSAFAPRIRGTTAESVTVIGMLVAVWSVNFLVILPAINPEFVALVPLSASFISKTLFGVAAASVFRWSGHHDNVEETINVK